MTAITETVDFRIDLHTNQQKEAGHIEPNHQANQRTQAPIKYLVVDQMISVKGKALGTHDPARRSSRTAGRKQFPGRALVR